jgi:hypothetical protein
MIPVPAEFNAAKPDRIRTVDLQDLVQDLSREL